MAVDWLPCRDGWRWCQASPCSQVHWSSPSAQTPNQQTNDHQKTIWSSPMLTNLLNRQNDHQQTKCLNPSAQTPTQHTKWSPTDNMIIPLSSDTYSTDKMIINKQHVNPIQLRHRINIQNDHQQIIWSYPSAQTPTQQKMIIMFSLDTHSSE